MLTAEEQGTLLSIIFPSFAIDIGSFSGVDFSGATVDPSSCLIIKDLDGTDLFREYPIRGSTGQKIGIVRSSSRGTELPLIDCMFFGKALFDPDTVKRELVDQLSRENPTANVDTDGFVCYGYPRVGLQVSIKRGDVVSKAIYDAHSRQLVRTWVSSNPSPPRLDSRLEGEPIYSYSSFLPEAGDTATAAQWNNYLRLAHSASVNRPGAIKGMTGLGDAISDAIRMTQGAPQPEEAPAMRGLLMPARLVSQETPVYCAVATGQMMLMYLGNTGVTQKDIAASFKTGASGTTNDDMIAGLNSLLPAWRAHVDFDASFDKANTLLQQILPMKSGIPGHARLLRGWREYLFLDRARGTIVFFDRYYFINDPYPPGGGQLVLENVHKPISDFYRNFLYFSHS